MTNLSEQLMESHKSVNEAVDANKARIALGSLNQALDKLHAKSEKLRGGNALDKMDDNKLKEIIAKAKELKATIADETKKFSK